MTLATTALQYYDGAAWVDISSYIDGEKVLRVKVGARSARINDRIAFTGTLHCYLDNHTVKGLFTPGHTNCMAGFDAGAAVKLALGGVYHFYGTIGDVVPDPGKYGKGLAKVIVYDWMAEAARYRVGDIPIQVDKFAGEIVDAILDNVPSTPANREISSGRHQFAFANPTGRGVTPTVTSALNKAAQSELGHIYIRRDTIVFEDRHTRYLNSLTSLYTFRDDSDRSDIVMSGMESGRSIDAVSNIIKCTAHPTTKDGALGTLWELDEVVEMVKGPNGTYDNLIIIGEYRDTAVDYRVAGAVDIVTPVKATDYTVNSQADGLGANLLTADDVTLATVKGGTEATFTFTNVYQGPAFILTLKIRGKKLKAYISKQAVSFDQTSITAYGERVTDLDLPYQDEYGDALNISRMLLNQRKDIETEVWTITFSANQSDTAMDAARDILLGDCITVVEGQSAVNEDFIVIGYIHEVTQQGILDVTYYLFPARYADFYFTWEQIADFEEGDVSDFDAISPDWDQTFDEQIADFDAVSPAWDKVVDAVADFDAEVDADGDLNDHADAAHDGAVGLAYKVDDANVMYGVMNASAINQTSGCVSFWCNFNTMGLSAGEYYWLFYAVDGVAGGNWNSIIYNDGGNIKANVRVTRDDASTAASGYGAALSKPGWHHFLYTWKRSTGAGANNGWMRLRVDGALYASVTGVDNDTKDWDTCRFGLCATGGIAAPSGYFFIDTIKIDPVGTLFVDKLAKKNGTYGLAVPIMDTTSRYGQFTGPTAETKITAECWIDPNTLTMATNDALAFISGDVTGDFIVGLTYDGANYKIYATAVLDAGTSQTSSYTITDAPHHVRMVWAASTGAGNDDGYLYLYIDGEFKEALTGLDNDTKNVGNVEFGAFGVDAGTYGFFYMDDCRWAGSSGPVGAYDFAEYAGDYGLWVPVIEKVDSYGIFLGPDAEAAIAVEFMLNRHDLYINQGVAGNAVQIVRCRDAATQTVFGMSIRHKATDGLYHLRAVAYLDADPGGSVIVGEKVINANTWYKVRFLYAACAPNFDDGYGVLFVDDVLIGMTTTVDNDTRRAADIWIGATDSTYAIDATGTILFDDIRWGRTW